MTSSTPSHVEAASTLAVIASSNEPLLFLTADLKLIAASASFCRAFGIDPASVPCRPLTELGRGEWAAPQLGSLLKAAVNGSTFDAYEFDLVRDGEDTRSLVLSVHRLDDGSDLPVRLLLAAADVTAARAAERHKDELVREKAILLQELQHRIANSLQIIASILMQSARLVPSEEARGPLRDAHHRVMSIAAVQRQLTATNLSEIALRDYLVQLCQSLGASMIPDSNRLAILVDVDDSLIGANASMSIGLIVTELVINALKHAFPDRRQGTIRVGYHADAQSWSLIVRDDGVGMLMGDGAAKPGLGTGIVDALTRQLEASIQVSDAGPGTLVSIIHDERAPRAELGPSVRATTPLPPEGALPAGSSGEPL
jgi:two-component sensor histidine kinase